MSRTGKDEIHSELEREIQRIRKENFVDYAGPLAGFSAGRHMINGQSILVTSSPTIIPGTHGDNSVIYDFIERLLGDEAIYLHAWLKLSREALVAKNLRRAQVMIIVGGIDQGKSLLLSLINSMLGGRRANPKQPLDGYTFNEDLFGAELLAMDDIGNDDTYRARKLLGDGLKTLVADDAPKCHGKGKKGITLTPFWRVIIACNDDLEALQVLPPLGKGIGDKIILLKTVGRAVDRPTRTTEEFIAYGQYLRAGLSDYLGWLERWKIPEEYLDSRFGLVPYRNQQVLNSLAEFNPETQLLHLMDTYLDFGNSKELEFTSQQLATQLKGSDITGTREAHDLLRNPISCGRYLGRLTELHPTRVRKGKRVGGGGSQKYIITSPAVARTESKVLGCLPSR